MEISQHQEGQVFVLALNGRFDAQSAGEVEESFMATMNDGANSVLVDMDGVEYVSSAGLRVLLATSKKLNAKGGKLILCGLKPYVWEVFEVAGFTTIFKILPDVASGLKDF